MYTGNSESVKRDYIIIPLFAASSNVDRFSKSFDRALKAHFHYAIWFEPAPNQLA